MAKVFKSRQKDRFPQLRELGIAAEYFPCYRNPAVRMHYVDVVLLSVVLKGSCLHIIADEEFSVEGVNIGITHYGQPHSIVTGEDSIEIMNIYLDLEKHPLLPELPSPLDRVMPFVLPLHPGLRNRANRVLFVDFEEDDRLEIANIVFELKRELDECKVAYQVAVADCFRLLMIKLCRQVWQSGFRFSVDFAGASSRLEKVLNYIELNSRRQLTLDDIAGTAGLSPGHLCRLFKSCMGRTVFAYLNERRIEAALFRLRTGSEKISDLAFSCGFNDLSYFNRTFKRITGCTPGGYRTKWLKLRR